MIPPSKKPYASGKLGIIACDKYATAVEVNMTRPIDNNPIGLRFFQKSFHEVFQAAAYNNGGRKIRKTVSGSNVTTGMPGIKPIHKPAITNNIGYEILSLTLSIDSRLTATSKDKTRKRLSCIILPKLDD
jgi:hypothetical protein